MDLADGDEMETLLTQYMNKLGQNISSVLFVDYICSHFVPQFDVG